MALSDADVAKQVQNLWKIFKNIVVNMKMKRTII